MKKVTINEIAKESGVSKSTVSRVLNHGDIVDEKTKKRVLSVMRKYQYSPSNVARNLSYGQSNTIGIIIPEIDNPFYGKILRTIVNAADNSGFTSMCFDTGNYGEKDVKFLRTLNNQRVSGIIYAPSVEYAGEEIEQEAKRIIDDLNMPIVLIDRNVQSFSKSGVFFDNLDASYRAAKILIAAGHTKIAIINGSHKIGIARDRHDGYVQAMNECGIPLLDQYIFEGDFARKKACELSKQMMELPVPPTAVITCNNSIGLGFLQIISEKKLRTPKDIEHIGIDEIDALDHLHIRYNHITRSRESMASKAMELLIGQIRQPNFSPYNIMIKPQFVLDKRLERIAVKNNIITKEKNQRRDAI